MGLRVGLMGASIICVCLLAPTDARAQALTLELENGLVTLNAQGVSVRQILERWATVGDVTVINGDKVGTLPVTLQLSGVPERAALETLLRDVSGYILGRRRQGAGAAIDRIMILPTSVASREAAAPASAPRPAIYGANETSAEGQVIVGAPPDVAVASPVAPAGAMGIATGSVGTAIAPGVLTPDARPTGRARPASMPLRFLDEPDAEGNRIRAPTVPTDDPAAQPASGAQGQGSKRAVPANPFGVTTGSSEPGTISPAPTRP